MEEWKEYKLSELLEIPIRNGLTKPKSIRGQGVKMIGMKEIFAYDIIRDCEMELVPVTEKEMCTSSILQDDLLFARQSLTLEGAGKCSIVGSVSDPTVFESHLIRLRINKNLANPYYIYYYFNSKYGKEQIKGLVQQVAAAGIRGKELINLRLSIPSLPTQQKIANILSSLDDKIEVNRRINEQLEELAGALFKSWFVDFEPFKDGEFVDSELGMIPKGWKVGTLSEILYISKDSVNPSKMPNCIFHHYSIPAYDNGKREETQEGNTILSNKFKIDDKTTLFSKLNPRIKRVWFVDDVEDNSICSTEFIPYKAKDKDLVYFVNSVLSSDYFYNKIMSIVNGATGSHQRFHPKDTLNFIFAYDMEVAKEYNNIVKPIITKILNNQQEIHHLTTLRDTLLPKLMSGEIDVNEVKI